MAILMLHRGAPSSRPCRSLGRPVRRMVDPAYAPGVRLLRVPDGTGGRVDRYVADGDRAVPELRPEADLGRPADLGTARRSRRTPSSAPAPSCAWRSPSRSRSTSRPPRTIPLTIVYEDDDLLIIDKPAGLVVHPAPGHAGGHARQRAAGPCRRRRRGAGSPASSGRASSTASIATRAGCSWSPSTTRPRLDLMAQLKAPPGEEDLPGAGPGQRLGGGRPDRGADRARPEAADADGGRAGRPAVRHRLPRPRAVRRLDAARARPRDRPDPPDPGPPRGDRPPDRGRPGLRHRARRDAARPGSTGCSSMPGGSSSPRRPTATSSGPRPPLPPSSKSVLDGLREVVR